MYFKPENITAIVEGRKTQTRRLVKPGETTIFSDDTNHRLVFANGRLKWETGRTYAVSPGRGKPGVWVDKSGKWYDPGVINLYDLAGIVYQPLRIRITAIRRERVQEIGPVDVMAEGITYNGDGYQVPGFPGDLFSYYKSAYQVLWDKINAAKDTRWESNPWCWVLSFEVVK